MVMLKVRVRLRRCEIYPPYLGIVRTVPCFARYTVAFALQLRKKARKKPQSGQEKSASWARFSGSTWPPFGGRQDKSVIPMSLL